MSSYAAPSAEATAEAGAFFGALEAQRLAVLRAVGDLPQRDALAAFVFEALTHAAGTAEGLTVDAAQALASPLGIDPVNDRLPGGLRPDEAERVSLLDVLLGAERPPAAIEVVNALFTLGYAARLEPLDAVERRTMTLRVVAMLPGVERQGPFVLTDYVDSVCGEEDALRFWQIYVDRVAAEISRRAPGEPRSAAEPWLFSRLLRLHEQGPTPPPSAAFLALTRHVNRVLQTHRYRWRFIRHLVEGCEDARMLHYLCTAPAVAQDPEVLPVFLTRGNDKLVSCALFTLYVYPDDETPVEAALNHLRSRPLPEVAARLVDLYAQLHLPRHPGSALLRLARGVRQLVAARLSEGPVDALLQAVANDARSLRQCLLLTDAVEAAEAVDRPRSEQLLERVVTTFFKAFTPSGIEHPLSDEVWRGGVRQALCRLIALEPDEVLGRLDAFGRSLGDEARRWYPDDDEASRAARTRLGSRFLGLFADTLLGVCRTMFAAGDDAGREHALSCYRLLVQVFRPHAGLVWGTGWFGAIEYVLPTFFPDLMATTEDGGPDDRITEAAALVARVEHELWPPPPSLLRLATPPPATAVPAAPASAPRPVEPALMRRRPTRERPLGAEAVPAGRSTRPVSVLLRAWLGIDVVGDGLRRLGALFGRRRTGRVTLTDREVIVEVETSWLGRARRDAEARALTDLRGVHVRQPARAFHLAFGIAVLAVGGVAGGHLVLGGLRDGDTRAALLGGALVALAIAIDAAMFRLFLRHRSALVLELWWGASPLRQRLLVDAAEAAPLLDAFMTADAERRELEQLAHWVGSDEAWEQ